MPYLFNTENNAADLAVIGLGPGGLAAALQAAQNGKTVVAFTNRREYIRGQRAVLSKETVEFLQQNTDYESGEYRDDYNFWQKFYKDNKSDESRIMQIKDIEKFLYRKLLKYPNVTIVPLDTTKTIQSVGVAKGKSADFIKLGDGTRYFCHNILEADGAKHSFADLMNTFLNSGIHYEKSKVQERHKYHAVVQLKLKENEQVSEEEFDELTEEEKKNLLVQFGWEETYPPKNIVFADGDYKKFYFVGEIPKKIFTAPLEEREALLKEWACAAIRERCNVTSEQLEYRRSLKSPSKNPLQSSTFEMNMVVCQQPFVELANGAFAQIGDARRSPNYNLTHGINDAIKGGVTFAMCLESQPFAKDKFLDTIQEMDSRLERTMQVQQEKEATEELEKSAHEAKIKAIEPLELLDDTAVQQEEIPPSIHSTPEQVEGKENETSLQFIKDKNRLKKINDSSTIYALLKVCNKVLSNLNEAPYDHRNIRDIGYIKQLKNCLTDQEKNNSERLQAFYDQKSIFKKEEQPSTFFQRFLKEIEETLDAVTCGAFSRVLKRDIWHESKLIGFFSGTEQVIKAQKEKEETAIKALEEVTLSDDPKPNI